jgi:hypothetical protein
VIEKSKMEFKIDSVNGMDEDEIYSSQAKVEEIVAQIKSL